MYSTILQHIKFTNYFNILTTIRTAAQTEPDKYNSCGCVHASSLSSRVFYLFTTNGIFFSRWCYWYIESIWWC